jgi:hypothetical protein
MAVRNVIYCAMMTEPRLTAIIHYSPDPDDCAIIKKDQVQRQSILFTRCLLILYIKDLSLRFWW